MAFIGIGAAVASALGFAGSTLVAGIVDFGVTTAASIGISYAAAALAGKPAPTTSAVSGGMNGTLQAGGALARSFPLGACATSGSLVYANTWGTASPGGNDTPNAYLTQVIALSDMPGSSLTDLWVNGSKVTYDPNGSRDTVNGIDLGVKIPEFIDTTGYLWIKFYDGTQTAADVLLTNLVSSDTHPYQSTRVGVGIAYAIVTSLTNDTLYTSFPTMLFGITGIPLYDPTKDSTNGGSGPQVYSNPATWGGDGDNLPAVQAYNVLRGIRYNGAWFYGLQQTTQANLPTVNWNAQIAKCRVAITGASGPEPTYRAGGQIAVSSQPADALDSIMTACQGKISEVGGFYKVHLGVPDAFSAAFTDDDILSTEDQTYTPFLSLADSINGITGTYPDPTQAWQTATAPPLYNAAFEAQDGSRRLLANPTFDLVPYPEQVQRLMSSALAAARQERSHAIVLPPPFWPLEPGDTVRWNSVRNGYVDKDFVVTSIADQANCDVGVNILEVDPTDYDWDHNTDYKPPTTGPTTFLPVPAQGITDWFAVGTIINDSSGSPRRPAIALSWDGDMPGVVGVQYQVQHKNVDGTWTVVAAGRTDQLTAGTLLISQSLLPNTAYQARGQYIPSAPRDMLWSDWLDVTTPNVLLTLADFDDTVTALINGIDQFDSDGINQALNLIASVVSNVNALTSVDKQAVRSELDAVAGGAKASIESLQTVVANNEEAFAEFSTTVSATFGSSFSTINTVSDAVATIDGQTAAAVSLTLDVNGFVVGTQFVNGGPGADSFTVTTDKFQVAAPGVSGGDPVPIFTVANIAGAPAVGINGDLVVDGSLTPRSINTGSLAAISANLGNITTGQIQSPDGLFLIDATNKRIIISDLT